MKRIIALVLGLVVLAGCGAVTQEMPETVSLPISINQTISDAPYYDYTTAVPAPTNSEGEERFQLYAELPEEDIYLYEVRGRNPQSGMVLFQGDSANYFSGWNAGRRFNDLVKIVYHDFDDDGEREIGITTGIIAGGSGPSVFDLHILKVHEDTPYPNTEIKTVRYTEYVFNVTDYFIERMTWQRGKEPNTLELKVDGQTFLVQLRSDRVWDEGIGVDVGHRIHFFFREDGAIEFSGLARVWYTYFERSEGLGYFNAVVVFDGKEFHLTNIDFEPF